MAKQALKKQTPKASTKKTFPAPAPAPAPPPVIDDQGNVIQFESDRVGDLRIRAMRTRKGQLKLDVRPFLPATATWAGGWAKGLRVDADEVVPLLVSIVKAVANSEIEKSLNDADRETLYSL